MQKLMIALLSLACFATPVSAGCAWVLWGSGGPNALGSRFLAGAYDTRTECMSAAKERYNKKDAFVPDWVCLPDTIDPRGPKGK
jgi:hypothetical protein